MEQKLRGQDFDQALNDWDVRSCFPLRPSQLRRAVISFTKATFEGERAIANTNDTTHWDECANHTQSAILSLTLSSEAQLTCIAVLFLPVWLRLTVLHQKGDLHDPITFLSQHSDLRLALSGAQPLLDSVKSKDDFRSHVPQAPTPLSNSPDDHRPSSLSGPMSETVDGAARGKISPEALPAPKRLMKQRLGFPRLAD